MGKEKKSCKEYNHTFDIKMAIKHGKMFKVIKKEVQIKNKVKQLQYLVMLKVKGNKLDR